MHHFLKETDFTPEQAQHVFLLAKQFKDDRLNCPQTLKKQSWGLLFYKSSTRTRISFEVGVNELGGFPIVLDSQNTQIGRGETIADTAKVVSQYLHGLVIRTYGHEIVEEFAKHATMPIVGTVIGPPVSASYSIRILYHAGPTFTHHTPWFLPGVTLSRLALVTACHFPNYPL